MRFQYNDGGREAAGYRGKTRDCVVRAIAIATSSPYQEIYDLVAGKSTTERTVRGRSKSSARNGVHKKTFKTLLADLGWQWVPVMSIGSGCSMHMTDGELPSGRVIVSLSKHLAAVIDGVLHDTDDCSRGGTRCVYGYWTKGS